MKKTDKVAILLASYNGDKYIEEQLKSLLKQTATNWTCYIHDDGSTDYTRKIIERYSKNYPDKFVVLEGASTKGAKYNFIYLFSQVEAPIYMCCDQDDIWIKDKIRISLDEINLIEKKFGKTLPILTFTDLIVVDSKMNEIAPSMNSYQGIDCSQLSINRLMVDNVVTGCTMTVNRSLRDMLIRVEDVTNIIMHDWYSALIASKFGVIKYIKTPTVLYRQHGSNEVGANFKYNISYLYSRVTSATQVRLKIVDMSKQVNEFVKIYKIKGENCLTEFSNIFEYTKFTRLQKYRKYNIRKNDFIKSVGFYIYG